MNVIKRDGRKVEFDGNKITSAVIKAFNEVGGYEEVYAKEKARSIAKHISDKEIDEITVEEIQDAIEECLMRSKCSNVAKAYIIYRNDRSRIREQKSQLMKTISEKLNASNVQNQNANVDEKSFGGRMGEATSAVMRDYALNNCMSETSRNNHLNNEIYEHDLDSYAVGMHNCLSVPFDKLLAKGFNTRQTDVRPAQSVSTAFQLVAVLFQLQSLQQFGGVSGTHLDWTMVPYVRKSFKKHWNDGVKYVADTKRFPSHWKIVTEELPINEYPDYDDCAPTYYYALEMTEKEIYQAVEGMYHNLRY